MQAATGTTHIKRILPTKYRFCKYKARIDKLPEINNKEFRLPSLPYREKYQVVWKSRSLLAL